MPKKNAKVLFAAGGTGGHLFPAIAVADEIRKLEPSAEFLFLGAKGKIEERVVPSRDFPFRAVWISGFARSFKPANLLVPLKVMVSIMQSIRHIRRFRPDVVVGTGGFVTGPVLYAATLLHLPTLLQEQNSYPGFTTRILAARVNEVHTAFEETRKFLSPRAVVKLSGNPTRATLVSVSKEAGAKFFQLNPQKKTVLVFGGSLGAGSINSAVLDLVDDIVAANFQLIWQTGEGDYEKARNKTWGLSGVRVEKFIHRMEYAYAAADLVVCRAGAVTIAEITRLGKAAVLVPFPHAAAGHQLKNAQALVNAGAAKMILDRELQSRLRDVLFELLQDDEQRKQIGRNSQRLGKPNAAQDIAEAILRLAERRQARNGRAKESLQI